MLPGLRIPRDWEDVTPGWMTSALASRLPEARVSRVELVTRDDGTNRRARFHLGYAQGSGPDSVFIKAHAASHRWVHLRNGNLFNEARLFASGTELPLEHPLVYRAVADYLRLDFLLVMEDLVQRGADMRDATRPLSVAQTANGLRALARLHSKYRAGNSAAWSGLRWVKPWRASQGWQVGLRKRVPRGLLRAGESLPAAVRGLSGEDIVDLWARYVGTLGRGATTLLHGDAHIGNTYVLPGDEVGFLDWQVVRRGHWSQDLGYFLVSALSAADRREAGEELVETYRQALELPERERPARDECWLCYRASPCYGLAIWLSTLGTDGYQSRAVSSALARRFAAAFVELEGESALRALGG